MSEAVRTILGADGAAAKGPGRDAEAGFLWDFWYPAARSGEIRGNRLVTATLLEVPGGAAGFGADFGGQGVCDAGFLSAPGDATFLWAF